MSELEKLKIIGYTLAGVPVWPISGAEPDNDGGDDNDDDDGGNDDNDDDDDSGNEDGSEDDGDDDKKKTEAASKIAAARKQAAKYRTRLKPWNALEAEHGSIEQIKAKLSGTASNEDVEKVRREAQETVTSFRKKLASATVRSLANEFADPDDAVRFVDLSSIEVDDDGSIDEDEIQSELDAILERKPHLRKASSSKTVRRPKPDKSQGSGKNNGGKEGGSIESGAEKFKQLMGKK